MKYLMPVCMLAMLLPPLSNLDGTKADAAEWQDDFEKLEFTVGDSTLRYRLLTPKSEDADKQFPLVVFLHGAGERGDDNEAQLVHGAVEFQKRQSTNPCFVLAPQVPKNMRWVDVDWSQDTGKGAFADAPSPTMGMTLQVIQELLDSGKVDPQRVYITGLSMGGYGTWHASVMKDSPFAAAAPVCGGGFGKLVCSRFFAKLLIGSIMRLAGEGLAQGLARKQRQRLSAL